MLLISNKTLNLSVIIVSRSLNLSKDAHLGHRYLGSVGFADHYPES